jgi:hypothetical protein
VVAWGLEGEVECTLPRPAIEVVGRDGASVSAGSQRVRLGPAPRYYRLGSGE